MVDLPWVRMATAGDREYLAIVSYLPLRRYRTIPRFIRYYRAIGRQLRRSRGLVGFSLRAKFLARKFYTVSVWEDEGALMEFVRAAPHLDTMQVLPPELGETKFVRWTLAGTEVPPTWERAIQVLERG